MTSFLTHARLYATFHQRTINRYLQMVSVPLMLLAVLIVLACIHISVPGFLEMNLAQIAVLIMAIHYIRLNWRLGLTVTPVLILLCWLAMAISYPTLSVFTLWGFVISLVLGIVLHIVGYVFEGKYPSNMKEHVRQIFIAPLLMAADFYFIAGKMQSLKQEIYLRN